MTFYVRFYEERAERVRVFYRLVAQFIIASSFLSIPHCDKHFSFLPLGQEHSLMSPRTFRHLLLIILRNHIDHDNLSVSMSLINDKMKS
jgi:hypothetical protein